MISEAKWSNLLERMQSLQIFEEDITEKFIRSSGSGGQKVNKSNSCVYLKHESSGMEVKCQRTRSQQENRFFARRLLCDKIENERLGRKSEEQQKREKVRRQKRKRSKRAKEKMLTEKKQRSQVKESRKKPSLKD